MISTNQVIEILLKKYNLKIDRAVLRRYADLELIEGRKLGGGKGKGVKIYYQDTILGKVFAIKELLKQNFKLAEISKYREMVYKEPLKNFQAFINNPAKSLEIAKLYAVVAFFAAAEAGIDFNQYSFSKNLSYELITLNVNYLTVKLKDVGALLTGLIPDSDFDWKPIKTVIFKNNQVIVS